MYIFKLLSIFLLFSLNISSSKPAVGRLNIVISGIKVQQGSVRVAIYNSAETFLDAKKFIFSNNTSVGTNKQVQLSFEIPYGTYAVTCYHDINNDHNLDKSTFGFPIEPYALSINNDIKWRRPTYNETKFTFQEPFRNLNLELKLWRER